MTLPGSRTTLAPRSATEWIFAQRHMNIYIYSWTYTYTYTYTYTCVYIYKSICTYIYMQSQRFLHHSSRLNRSRRQSQSQSLIGPSSGNDLGFPWRTIGLSGPNRSSRVFFCGLLAVKNPTAPMKHKCYKPIPVLVARTWVSLL